LPFSNQLVAHTSGSVALDALDAKNRRAVFYPLQTFSKSRTVDYSHVPVCIEWEYTSDRQLLTDLASCISPNCYTINSEQRKALHVAAVMVNNFVNHLYHIGEEISLKGWLFNKRSSGKIRFIILRDGTGYLQCIYFKGNVSEEIFNLADRLGQESSIEFKGKVKAEPRAVGGYELDATDL
jgi:lysyl-tRNA synthetase class II